MTTTYADLLGAHQVDIPAHLTADAEIPVSAALQIQGDVAIIPTRKGKTAATRIPAGGVPVVRGENGGNTHLLVADGPVLWHPATNGGTTLGQVVVPKGSVAYLLHPEHGAQGIAPGSYILRRQREQADEIRMIAD